MNYPQPQELHDYRYLGDDYRQHERITRKKNRWVDRLSMMPVAKRYPLLSALEELGGTTPP